MYSLRCHYKESGIYIYDERMFLIIFMLSRITIGNTRKCVKIETSSIPYQIHIYITNHLWAKCKQCCSLQYGTRLVVGRKEMDTGRFYYSRLSSGKLLLFLKIQHSEYWLFVWNTDLWHCWEIRSITKVICPQNFRESKMNSSKFSTITLRHSGAMTIKYGTRLVRERKWID